MNREPGRSDRQRRPYYGNDDYDNYTYGGNRGNGNRAYRNDGYRNDGYRSDEYRNYRRGNNSHGGYGSQNDGRGYYNGQHQYRDYGRQRNNQPLRNSGGYRSNERNRQNNRWDYDSYPEYSYSDYYGSADYNWNRGASENRSSGLSTKKKWLIAGLAVLGVLLLLLCIVAGGISCVLGKINYMSGDELLIPDNLDSIVLEDDDITSESDTLDDAQKQEIDANVKESTVGEDGLRYEDGVTNILVFGIDARSSTAKRARSDAIILVSINENSKQIVLSSIMRDTYVSIPGRSGNDKLNAAYAYGGPALAVETVEGAFGVRIDHFVSVNFYAFMDIVDALGGVTVDINSGEQKHINNYIAEINALSGLGADNGKLYKTGNDILLTGKQAMGYVRVRYSGNGDYERTERQREVLEQLIEKARTADYSTLVSMLDKVASKVSTDYTMGEITELALNAAKYIDYDISQLRLPADGTYWSGIYNGTWILDIDFKTNRELLYKTIFDNFEG